MIEVLVIAVVSLVVSFLSALGGGYLVWRRYQSAIQKVDKRLTLLAYNQLLAVRRLVDKTKKQVNYNEIIVPEIVLVLKSLIEETGKATDDVMKTLNKR